MLAKLSPTWESEGAGDDPSSSRRPTVNAYIKSGHSRDQLSTILMDVLDWGPFELIHLTLDEKSENTAEPRYVATFEIDSGAARPNSRNHFEWGLMLLGVLDNHFRKDPRCRNSSYVVPQDHEFARGVVTQEN